MATRKSEREMRREVLKMLFDQWEKMSDEELLAELRRVIGYNAETSSRHNTIKWLVLKFVDQNLI